MAAITYAVKYVQETPWSKLLKLSPAKSVRLIILTGWTVLLIAYADLPDIKLDPTAQYALAGGMAGLAATAFGALPALLLRRISTRMEDILLGLSAGMMLAASAFSLILPGIEAGTRLTGTRAMGVTLVVSGLALGAALMLGLDRIVPHTHAHSGHQGLGVNRISQAYLFAFAIALHNLPEGMAIGVSFAQSDAHTAIPLTSAIALQDVPEGLAVALALRSAGLNALVAIGLAILSGILEPLGALVGVGLTQSWGFAYPLGLGIAAGAMLFVVSHEVIPETHRKGHQTAATIGLIGGFIMMTVLDTALG